MKNKKNILDDPFYIKILNFVDGKSNIMDISKKVGMTYKTVFYKIKNLEKEGYINFIKHTPHISKENKSEINAKLNMYNALEEELSKSLKNKKLKEKIIKGLNFIKNNRGLSKKKAYEILRIEPAYKHHQIFNSLLEIGLIRDRVEITKKGKQFLKEHESKKPKKTS